MSLLAALAPLLHLVAPAHVLAPQDCFERSAAIERPSQRVLFVGNSDPDSAETLQALAWRAIVGLPPRRVF